MEREAQTDPPPRTHEPYGLPVAVQAQQVPKRSDLNHPSLYFNRELGDLDFDARVLAQAMDPRTPLLERVRFVSIAASNLDEFVMKRVGGLLRQQAAGVQTPSIDGRTASEQLSLVGAAMLPLYRKMEALWRDELRPELRRQAALDVIDIDDVADDEWDGLEVVFERDLYPIVTPLAVDSGRPFPLISNLSLSLAVRLDAAQQGNDSPLFVRIKVPTNLGRFVRTTRGRWVPIEQLLERYVDRFFPGARVRDAYRFRVTRNADTRMDEEEADDLLAAIGAELRERRFAPVVRIEVERRMPQDVRAYLMRQLDVDAERVHEADRVLALADVSELIDHASGGPELRFRPFQGATAQRIVEHDEASAGASLFGLIRQRDLLVHHPYERFETSTQRFIEEAAQDPNVLAIKQTLYRTSANSPVVAALVRAAESGKQVAVLVEVKARFDEANNIEWGQRLEEAGVHVSYGLIGLKIHTKMVLVIRRDEDGIRTYAHVGTGNYNAQTARQYTDLGLFTAHSGIGSDLADLFHHITGYAPGQTYEHLLVAPWEMRDAFIRRINREAEHARAGRAARIVAKMNGLDDGPIIQALYAASQAGVDVELIIRGHSRLRPGVPGFSERIRVISILGRFLEHDRVFTFYNDGDLDVLIGSADWKRRNLSDRIEAIVPVHDVGLKARLMSYLEQALSDPRGAWDLHADGRYVQRTPTTGGPHVGLQDALTAGAIPPED